MSADQTEQTPLLPGPIPANRLAEQRLCPIDNQHCDCDEVKKLLGLTIALFLSLTGLIVFAKHVHLQHLAGPSPSEGMSDADSRSIRHVWRERAGELRPTNAVQPEPTKTVGVLPLDLDDMGTCAFE